VKIMSERLGQLDLVFVVDNTGSMGSYIEVTKSKILEIIRTIKKEELCHRLRVGLVAYRDHPPEEETWVVQKFELTPDTAAIEENVKRMEASGGGDGPEAVDTALMTANRMEFLRDAAKIMVLIGDAPPHGVESTGAFSKGSPDGASYKTETKNAYEKGIVIHTIGCYPEIESYEKAVEVYKEIAEKSKGRFFPLNEAELLVPLITGIAVEEIDKLSIQQSILEELGTSVEDLKVEDLSDAKLETIAASIAGKGLKRRSVKHEASSSASAPESVELEEQSVSDEDIREAVRQLKKKAE
jgi:Mg-chelatase subunit ChlD